MPHHDILRGCVDSPTYAIPTHTHELHHPFVENDKVANFAALDQLVGIGCHLYELHKRLIVVPKKMHAAILKPINQSDRTNVQWHTKLIGNRAMVK